MYNKEFFEKVVNVDCSFKELKSFCANIDKEKYDTDNAFEKYYNVESILKAINRYKNGEVSDIYLACWANAYDWIIMAGFKSVKNSAGITFREWLEWEISDFLDSLSFFDASYSWYDADDYEKGFKRIDAIYKNSDDWNCFFSPAAVTHGYDDVDMLLVNRKTKKFIKTCSESDCVDGKGDMKKLKSDEMKKEIAKLKAAGYRKSKW